MIESSTLAALFLGFLILLSLVRLVAGPTTPDRVVAMDTIGTLTVALMILLGLVYRQVVFVDVAIVYALFSFVGTLFITRYMGKEDR
jgi:multicomponent Na+:H+ antiporter subunit F